jgi:DNA-binding GntR family transcriptional regulator
MPVEKTMTVIERPQTIGDRVYQQLRDHILFSPAPNFRLIESDLTKQLQVSRTPVREALTRLASEGYIVSAERGYEIPTITPADIDNLFQMRELLEPVAARQAAENLSNLGFTDMEAAIETETKAHRRGDVSRFVAANVAFREAWLLRVRNPMLLEALSRTMRTYQIMRRRFLSNAAVRALSIDTQVAFLAACKARDPDKAELTQRDAIARIRAQVGQDFYVPATGAPAKVRRTAR